MVLISGHLLNERDKNGYHYKMASPTGEDIVVLVHHAVVWLSPGPIMELYMADVGIVPHFDVVHLLVVA